MLYSHRLNGYAGESRAEIGVLKDICGVQYVTVGAKSDIVSCLAIITCQIVLLEIF